jgi:hypothetical protein
VSIVRRSILVALPLGVLVGSVVLQPVEASAQARRRAPTRVVSVRGFSAPVYRPFYGGFYSPFYDPWFGPGWGWGWGGYPWGWGGWSIAPSQASVRLDVRPRDAQVCVDGYFAGDVDQFDGALQRLRLPPGQHEIVIYKEGYRSHRERLYLPVNSSRKVTYDLDRLAAGEPNDPRPVPAAEPERDQASNEVGPAPPPRRDMRPRRGGPLPQTRRPPARSEGAPSSSSLGTVSIRVQPADADIVIDGERWMGGGDDERLIVQLSEGAHQVDVRKEGYRAVTVEVTVRRGETAPVNVSLSRE